MIRRRRESRSGREIAITKSLAQPAAGGSALAGWRAAAYLEAAPEEGDASLVAAALGDIARAKGMSSIAKETGLGRASLYKALSPEGNPELDTILRVVRSFGLRLHAKAS